MGCNLPRAHRCGAGSSAAAVSGPAVKAREEGSAGAAARSAWAVPAPCSPPWGCQSWGAALAAVTCATGSLYMPAFKE